MDASGNKLKLKLKFKINILTNKKVIRILEL